MNILSITIGKTILKLLRALGSHGSALPGLIIEKINPNFLKHTLSYLPKGVVIVSGTNGKTTTTKSLVSILENEGLKVFSNPSGSNFTRGVISEILDKVNLNGSLDYDIAVLELDEAFSRIFVKQVSPQYVLLLNVMRDQLDRYGEIDTTANMLLETATAATKGVILNADDNRLRAFKSKLTDQVVSYYGVSDQLRSLVPNDDELLGSKSFHSSKAHKDVTLESFNNEIAKFNIEGNICSANLNIAGIHNAVNLTGAIAAARLIKPDLKINTLMTIIEDLKPAWGRGEKVKIGDKNITIALVKNPAGFSQVIRSYSKSKFDTAVFSINDDFADGRDVSWLWDVDYTTYDKKLNSYVSGLRAYDMALLLGYKDIDVKDVKQEENTIIQQVLDSESNEIIVFCTYTSMLKIRKILSSMSEAEARPW